MGSRRATIGILYQPDKNWIAGAYYVQNIVYALGQYCSKKTMPHIIIFCNTKVDFDEFKKHTNYPLLSCHLLIKKHSRVQRIIIKIIKKTIGIRLDNGGKIPALTLKRIRFVYPLDNTEIISDKTKLLSWIPDFQERYYPEFFSAEDIKSRDGWHKRLIADNIPVVFSSQDARQDFYKFYPQANRHKTFVLSFSVKHPDFSHENIDEIKRKYGITGDYLFCANQFWIHKNHMLLFKSMKILHNQGSKLQLVCSGALHDYRTDTYHTELSDFIENNDLSNTIKIIGFIPRTEQLCLMKNSYAIVQPSLFEGWSTVVEDAKKLNKYIFLSNLSVHREQNPANVCFFNPKNENELADKILNTQITEKKTDYHDNVVQSGKSFWEIIDCFDLH